MKAIQGLRFTHAMNKLTGGAGSQGWIPMQAPTAEIPADAKTEATADDYDWSSPERSAIPVIGAGEKKEAPKKHGGGKVMDIQENIARGKARDMRDQGGRSQKDRIQQQQKTGGSIADRQRGTR